MTNRVRDLLAGVVMATAVAALPLEAAVAQDTPTGESKLQRSAAIGLDVLIVRPLSLVSLIAGAGFVYPASVLAAPNSTDARENVVDVLWTTPLEHLTEPRLGELD